ncbi:MAG: Nicotinate phosphoribosyltransferase pncB2 [Syntrophomonadaceae bacterium]|nr:Nicotinate phosphoribosyltransferase pncB2 [Bacillota bacterium]
MRELRSMADLQQFIPDGTRLFHSASHEEILAGATTDVYFVRTLEILRAAGKEETLVTAEIFSGGAGTFCGLQEAVQLLQRKQVEVWALSEGEEFAVREVVMRLRGSYSEFGLYETAILGMLASASGWATAARRCKEAAGGKAVYCFGARHVHPSVAPVMERAAVVGGADGCSCVLGAVLAGKKPTGTVPHAVMLIMGDTLEAAKVFDRIMPPEDPRVILVDTFKDEAEEALRVAECLRARLAGVRLDTPRERGGVTAGLVREVRARLDQAGFTHVRLVVSGGLSAERMPALAAAGADAFGVGSYISRSPAIDMTMDLKEVEGKPVAKRGRIPGITESKRLSKIL